MNTASAPKQSRYARPKPCIGYPSQTEAVIALYEAGNHPKLIAKRAGIPLNSVYRAICYYRRSSGRTVTAKPIEPVVEEAVQPHSPIWDTEEPRRRLAFIARAQQGAKQTLEAAGL